METPVDNNLLIIGRIRHLMEFQHLSQVAFSKLIGIDPSNVSKYLSGKLPVSDSLLNRIVVNLNVSKKTNHYYNHSWEHRSTITCS